MKLPSVSKTLSMPLPNTRNHSHRLWTVFGLFVVVFALLTMLPPVALGETQEEIQQRIIEQNEKIAQLEKEIAQYERELQTIGGQKKTLENEIKQLDVSRKKITANISATENKIKQATLQIQTLTGQIGDKEEHITLNKNAVRESLQNAYQVGATTLVEHLLTVRGLEEAWEEMDRLRSLETTLQEKSVELLNTKEELEVDRTSTQKKQSELRALQRDLAGQKQVLDANRQEQANLLSQTKNKESTFQALLREKQDAKAKFERELTDYENALKFNLDPSSIPKAGSGVLSWPIDPTYMANCKSRQSAYGNVYCISQYFGHTEFARSGAYNGSGHNGIDFGIPTGTKIVSALSGTVQATGNTDAYKGCYSYGKWVLVKHLNGLTTLYAHLSVISVTQGDPVGIGTVLGYSGKTGYATGPHLHFTVYVSDAVKVVRYGDVKPKTNCANATIPVAPTEAYLNPFSYL